MCNWIPDLITLASCNGDWDEYLEAIYAIFCRDFKDAPLKEFTGKPVRLKRHPVEKDKEATFWHFISAGLVEADRVPDLRRCERIAWPRAFMENFSDPVLKVWTEVVKGEERTLILHEDTGYLVIVAQRSSYVLPWTAYPLQYANEVRRYVQRWEKAQK